MISKAKLEAFLQVTDDREPVMKAVRSLVKRELSRLLKIASNPGRPRLEDSPQREKWRAYQKAYRERKRQETI